MSLIINKAPPPDGNPEGILNAPLNALFFKTGSFYKINNSGSDAIGWDDVYFSYFYGPFSMRTAQDIELLENIELGTYLYVKTTEQVYNTGWKLLSKKSPFYPQFSPTPTTTPTATVTPTVTATFVLTQTPTTSPSLTITTSIKIIKRIKKWQAI
jgi:hypothetical protein